MKKFYLHNGTEQMGPFDMEELKTKDLTKKTPVWYEGLSEWTAAENVEELQGLLKVVPPPFGGHSNTPPPPGAVNGESESSAPPTKTHSLSQKKKKNYTRFVVILAICVITGGVLIFMNNPHAMPGVRFEINTPKPTIVTSRADSKKSGLFNARTTVYATVTNNGGDGEVVVTFHVYQGNHAYDRSKSVYLGAGQSQDLEVTFEEVDYISGDIVYDVSTAAR